MGSIFPLWTNMPNKYEGFEKDLFVVMLNQLYGILILERGPARGPAHFT